jgi:DegV family protein with EDD domain
MGYGWAVVEGARMANNGASPDEIEAYIRDWTEHVRILFVPFDLKFAKKSGRISAAAAFVGEALGLKPIMTFEDGQSQVVTKVRGEKNVIPTLLELCKKDREENTPYMVIRADRPDQADLLFQACAQEFGQPASLEYYIGAIISINAGPNFTGLIYRKK